MKVWVVAAWECEGITILKIFNSQEKADKFADKMNKETNWVIKLYEHDVE